MFIQEQMAVKPAKSAAKTSDCIPLLESELVLAIVCFASVSYTHLDVYKRQANLVPNEREILFLHAHPTAQCSGHTHLQLAQGRG